MNRRLYRSRRDSVLGGVAGGVAEYLDVDPSIVRIIWAILAIVTGGLFVVLYVVMWIVVPDSPSAGAAHPAAGMTGTASPGGPPQPAAAEPAWSGEQPRHRSGSSNGTLIFGLILIGAGVWFLVDDYLPDIDRRFLWPVALVVVGAALLVIAMRRPRPQ